MNNLDIDILFKGFNALALIASGILNVYLFFKTKSDQRFKDLEQCHEDLQTEVRLAVAERKAHHADHETRLQLVESNLENLPTHEDLRKVYEQLSKLVSQVERQDERSRHATEALRRIEDHLLDR